MLGERFLWPPYLGPSVSIRQHSSRPPPHGPSLLGRQHPHVYSITTHYSVSAWRHGLRTQRDGDEEGSAFTKRKNDPHSVFIKIPPFLCFLEVITGLPKLNWGK